MVFVERISHITAQVEYGLVPADSQLRRYDEKGCLIGNERMELLSPMVFEDTVRGTFFFAERRPLSPASSPTQEKKGDDKDDKASEKKDEEQKLKRKGSKGKKANTNGTQDKEKVDKDATSQPSIPTLLEQLVKLRVLRIIPNVRCKSIEHKGACLVRVLLTDSEVCTSFRSNATSADKHSRSLIHAPAPVIHTFFTKLLSTHVSRYVSPLHKTKSLIKQWLYRFVQAVVPCPFAVAYTTAAKPASPPIGHSTA